MYPANNTIWAPCWPHVGGPDGPMRTALTGPIQNWPGGATRGHLGDTHGTHLGPTTDQSGPHMGSPYWPQVGPMMVARRATYGRPTWGPRRIVQGGATMCPFGRHTWDPSGPHTGSLYRPQVGPMRVARRTNYGRPTWAHAELALGYFHNIILN